MKKKIVFIALAVMFGAATRTAAQNQGVDFFLVEQYDKAKAFFEQQLKTGGNAAEANYYLGEIAYQQGKLDEAKTYYTKGLAADAAYPLNSVGLARFTAKTDPKAADKELQAAIKLDKKNVTLLLAAAKVYLENGMQENAEKTVTAADKADKKSPLVPMFNGDLKKSKDVGAAASEYEQAILRNRSYPIPYIKIAQIYVEVNPRAALERLGEVLEMQPDYLLAKQYQGRAYYNIGAYDRAIEVYQKIFNENTSPINDLTDYAAALFFAQRYEEAMRLINKGVAKDPNNFVLNRLLMYSALEQSDYEQGLTVAKKFFAIPLNNNKYIQRDYTTYGDLLGAKQQQQQQELTKQQQELARQQQAVAKQQEELVRQQQELARQATTKQQKDAAKQQMELARQQQNAAQQQIAAAQQQLAAVKQQIVALRPQIDLAVAQYRKAVDIVPEAEQAEIYRQLSDKLNKGGYFEQAADFYQKYVEARMLQDGEIGAVEYFTLGQYYYKAATQIAKDSTRIAELPPLLDKADSAFATVTELAPDNISSILFRARINALRDPSSEAGLAKPVYEAALAVIVVKEDYQKQYRRELLEIYRYLSYYAYLQYDKNDAKSKEKESYKQETLDFCQKMLALDPNNAIAKQLTDALTEQPKPAAKKK
jgi:tetratricopeptide (TPR) repeat protein